MGPHELQAEIKTKGKFVVIKIRTVGHYWSISARDRNETLFVAVLNQDEAVADRAFIAAFREFPDKE
jgi:hypothetical protein